MSLREKNRENLNFVSSQSYVFCSFAGLQLSKQGAHTRTYGKEQAKNLIGMQAVLK